MQQPNYTPDFERVGFRPAQAPDLTKGMAENRAAQRASQNAIIQQMIADKSTIAANNRAAAEGMQALAKFSQTLTGQVIKAAERKADDEFAEGLLYAYENQESLQKDNTEAELKAEGEQINDAAAKTRPEDSDVVVPALRGSRFFQMGVNQGRTMTAMQTDYLPFMEDAVKNANPQNSQELAVVMANARKEFFMKANIDRKSLSNGFLVNKLFPALTKLDASLNTKFRRQIAVENSENVRVEAWAKFSNDKDLSSYLKTVGNSVGADGERLRFGGAWDMLIKNMSQGIAGGSITESAIAEMEKQPIPNDPKGRTYGELHRDKFAKARLAARQARVSQWNLSQSERKAKAEQDEEMLVAPFLDPNDADGYTDAQIEEAQEKFQSVHGYRSRRIDNLLNSSVDAQTRKKQEEQIQDLQALGLLTPERLSKFDRKLQAKYMSTAQQQAKLSSSRNNYKAELDAISAAVKNGPNNEMAAVPVGKGHYSVKIMETQMHQYFLRKVQEYAISNPDRAAELARNDTIDYFKQTAKVSKNGYVGVMPDANSTQTERIKAEYRISEINDTITTYGKPSIYKPFAFFDQAQLEDMVKGYGKPGWTPDPSLVYIADKLGVDPLTVLNAQLKAIKMDELPMTPAAKTVTNNMTAAQRSALNNIGRTPGNEIVSSRTMGSMGYREELVPKTYGPMVTKAAGAAGVPPAHIAAMAEIESNWNTNAPSYNQSSFGLMQINRAAHPLFFQQNDWRDPQANLNYGAEYYGSLLKVYKDPVAAAMAYNGGPGNYEAYLNGTLPDGPVKTEMINHGRKFQQALYKYGGGAQENYRPQALRGNSNKLRAAATSYVGMDTSAGPDAGENACVWAINKVFARAGMPVPWGNSVYVPHVKDVLDQSATRLSGPEPGAIAIMQDNGSPPYPHIGLVQADGSIISNSSSRAKFDWVDSPEAYERKYGRPNLYYKL